MVTEGRREAAEVVFDYLFLRDGPPRKRCDLIIGFGHFDPAIPRHCCDLYMAGLAPRILFTGGVGAGSADLSVPEAHFFYDTARAYCPRIPHDAYVLEGDSTNTGENVQFSLARLAKLESPMRPGRELRSAILVASPYRQRRVWLTCRRHMPRVRFHNAPPPSSWARERGKFRVQGQEITDLVRGEVQRLVRYGCRGYIVQCIVPSEVLTACDAIDANVRMETGDGTTGRNSARVWWNGGAFIGDQAGDLSVPAPDRLHDGGGDVGGGDL